MKENRKKYRVRLQKPIGVSISSIGSTLYYDLVTDDISISGFFLAFDSPSRFPFLSSSILEVWMNIPGGDKLFFNAKMVRVVNSDLLTVESKKKGVAIRIIQINPEAKEALQAFIDLCAKNNEQRKSEKKELSPEEQPSSQSLPAA
ncbi:MAG: PilZ domain-containing protein [Proteobacteria bacterium]|nr:PilZ domain-containing protein [Pseudomonadota bacterium]